MTSSSRKQWESMIGVIAIAVTYIYFLLYAQFGFVSYLKLFFPDPLYTEKGMGAMGAGGLLFSILTAVLLRTQTSRMMLAISFSGCAFAALLTLVHASITLFLIAAFLIGGFAGMLTVTLAAGLRNWIPSSRFGLFVGLGTGLAYLICNIPALFDASPKVQTLFSAMICLPGLWCALRPLPVEQDQEAWTPQLSPGEFRGLGFVSIVLMFLALVWLDSTAFATIQLTETLRSHTWGSPGMKITLGIFHAVAAVVAGWLIDRRHMRSLLAGTFGLFAIAFTLLQSNSIASWTSGPLYAFGISVYSTALVAFPSLYPDKPGSVPVRWRAAILYAVAGWIGSGLGVGLAQHLHSIPITLLFVAGIFIGGGLLFPLNAERRQWMKSYALVLAFGVFGVVCFSFLPANDIPQSGSPSVEFGRIVYKQEGCINCHSQFLRPNTPDVLLWGPHRDIDRTEKPPMVGNRRQGPDLMNAGLRRTALWHRQHLMDPQSLSPGSMMPSYAYLFSAGDPRGESLVLYLSSLGIKNAEARVASIKSWTLDATTIEAVSEERGKKVFETYCYICHGLEGKADGPLAGIFNQPSMNLAKGPFTYIPASLSNEEKNAALARIVKFGLVGLNMPGHEYFNDQDIADVVSYVRKLAAAGQAQP